MLQSMGSQRVGHDCTTDLKVFKMSLNLLTHDNSISVLFKNKQREYYVHR